MSKTYTNGFPKAWSDSEIETYKATGIEPEKAKNGVWVSDIEREASELKDWTLADLFALANNELISKYVAGDTDFYNAVRVKAVFEDTDAIHWGEEDLYNWLVYEKPPAKSPNGYYINDPDRWVKDATLWNDTELADLGAGYFGVPERSQLYIVDEAAERFDLPLGITFEEFSNWIKTKTLPKTTTSGVLINDRRRDIKSASDWTDLEVEAWVRSEITANDEIVSGLLSKAIAQFGGGRYWSLEQLRSFVVDNELPKIDYSKYSDKQLKILSKKDSDVDAEKELERRYPPVVIEKVVEVVVPEVIEEPVVTAPKYVIELEAPVIKIVEPVTETPEMTWEDVVAAGSPLYKLLSSPTPDYVIEDTERRRLLTASKWMPVELVGWARGLIAYGNNVTEDTLLAALRSLCGSFVSDWCDRSVKHFIASLELPEGFCEGVLVSSPTRDAKHPGAWTDEELKAWGKGKIKTTADEATIVLAARVRFQIPDRLTVMEVKEYLMTGQIPTDTIPAIEKGKPISLDQVNAWLRDEISAPKSETDRIYSTARQMHKIDVHWTDAHIHRFIRDGSKPDRLPNGILIEDRLRSQESFNDWTWLELKSLALGEIESKLPIKEAVGRIRRLIDVQFRKEHAHWDDAEVLAFIKSDITPKALEDGIYINDPTRPAKVPVEWRDGELRAWLRGDIESTENATEELLWDEVYRRFQIPIVWYREDAKTFVLTGNKIPSTPSGLWVRDRYRDTRPVKHWTRREIKAWCRGQILPGINTDHDTILRRAATLFGVSTLLDAESIKKRISEITEESMTMTVKFVTEDLISYKEGRIKAGDSATMNAPYQTLLDRCIGRVLRLEGEDFVQGWTELLTFFHVNSKGIMSAKKVYAGVGQMAITPRGLRNFQNMTSVLLQTADTATRDRAVRVIDWNAAMKEISNEKTRQSILAYYGVS